jgi:hypothetical protein
MTRHLVRVIALATVLALPLAAPATLKAQWSQWYGWDHFCVTGAFQSCGSVLIRTAPAGSGHTQFQIQVQNLSPNVFWSQLSALIFDGPGGGYWSGCDGIGWCSPGEWGFDNGGTPFGGTQSLELPFEFRESDLLVFYTETYSLIDPLQAGNFVYLGGPQYVTPEPVTIALLGIGLFGVGAARLRRRKKDQQIDA